MRFRWQQALFVFGLFAVAACVGAAPDPLFGKDQLLDITLQIDAPGMQALRKTPREYVKGRIRHGTNEFVEMKVRLKGHYTFRPIDAKPGFSLKLPRGKARQLFGGHKRFLLNNSAQDPSFMRAKLASELFLKAGLPTARINFARVTLNGKSLGPYLAVEATDGKFLEAHFGSADGNLYEGADQDIGDPLEVDSSKGRRDRSDLQSLLSTCLEENPQVRWDQLSAKLDVIEFASFMAMELVVAHIDGYSMDTNNYRIYHDPITGKFIFIAHGMDLILLNPVVRQDRHWRGIVARSFLQTAEGRKLYEQRLRKLGGNVYGNPSELVRQVAQAWQVIEPAFGDADEKQKASREVRDLQRILRSRAASFQQFVEEHQPGD